MLNLSPNQLFAQKYRLLRRLGEGGFSEVWLVYNEMAKFEQVIKIYNGLEGDGSDIFRREFTRAYHLTHTNILKATEYAIFDKKPYLVMPHMRGGSILSKLGRVGEKDIAKVMMDIGTALEHIHQPIYGLVHKDIKPDNIFIGNDGNYLLGDFGISTQLRQQFKAYAQRRSRSISSSAGLTPLAYRAPEYFESIKTKTDPIIASDIWAFGASLFELATGKLPFRELGGSAQFADAEPPDLPSQFSRGLNNILKACMAKEPWKRPKGKELRKLGQYYLTYGNWTPQYESFGHVDNTRETKKVVRSTTRGSAAPNERTIKDYNIGAAKDSRKWTLTAIISLMVAIGFACFTVSQNFFQATPVVIKEDTARGDTGIIVTPLDTLSPPVPVKEEPEEKIEEEVVDTKKQSYVSDEKDQLTPKSPYYFTKFYVQNDPADSQGACKASLKSVHLKDNVTEVVLHLKNCGIINLFPPGASNAFFIKAEGKEYLLTGVDKSIRAGSEVDVGSDKSFSLFFEPIPRHIRRFDMLEGKDKIAEGRHSFWHFEGIVLKK